MLLADRVCLVTGGARRVGRAVALAFAGRGARVVVHCRASLEAARETAEECTRLSGGRQAIVLAADQRDTHAVDGLVAQVVDQCGRIDVLINNAAVLGATSFLEMTPQEWDEGLETNLRGPAWFCRAAGRVMVEQGEGVIINIADVCADAPWPRFVPYGVAKAGLVALTRGLARELAPHVRVNAVSPGSVALSEGASESLRRRAAESAPLGRIGSPDDVAGACVFLVEHGDFITGAVLPVDGGSHLSTGMRATPGTP